MRAETKIFVSMFLVVFSSAFFCLFMLIPFYYGHPLVGLGRLTSWVSSLFIVFFFSFSLIIAGISVIFYKVYKMMKKGERNNSFSPSRGSTRLSPHSYFSIPSTVNAIPNNTKTIKGNEVPISWSIRLPLK